MGKKLQIFALLRSCEGAACGALGSEAGGGTWGLGGPGHRDEKRPRRGGRREPESLKMGAGEEISHLGKEADKCRDSSPAPPTRAYLRE